MNLVSRESCIRVVFTWVSRQSIRICFRFVLLRFVIGLKKKLAPLSQPIRTKTKTKQSTFPRASLLLQIHMLCFKVWLHSSLDCLCPLRMIVVITLLYFFISHSIGSLSILQRSSKKPFSVQNNSSLKICCSRFAIITYYVVSIDTQQSGFLLYICRISRSILQFVLQRIRW